MVDRGKASATAHAIQGLIKYHGLRDEKLRIPYHDSISVCVDKLSTKTTIQFDESLMKDVVTMNGRKPTVRELQRIESVLNPIRILAKTDVRARVASVNSLSKGKGLGFSASAFASLGLAATTALNLQLSRRKLTEIVRLGTGSATRSLVGGYAIWYAKKKGFSYAEQLAKPSDIDMQMIVVPIHSEVRTEMAHQDALTSPFFDARLTYLRGALAKMKRAIQLRDIARICELTEIDTLNLHATTMTGDSRLFVLKPETLQVMETVAQLRSTERVPAWYSMDTGPSVFVNTLPKYGSLVQKRILEETGLDSLRSGAGDGAALTNEHLFYQRAIRR